MAAGQLQASMKRPQRRTHRYDGRIAVKGGGAHREYCRCQDAIGQTQPSSPHITWEWRNALKPAIWRLDHAAQQDRSGHRAVMPWHA
jgi:hypothetical protein